MSPIASEAAQDGRDSRQRLGAVTTRGRYEAASGSTGMRSGVALYSDGDAAHRLRLGADAPASGDVGLGSRRVASACFQRRDSDATASALVLTRETARHRPARRTPLRVQLGSHLEVAACFGSRPISGGKPTNTPGGRVLEFRAWQHVTLAPAAYRGGTEIGVARSGSRSSRWSRAWIERTRRSRVS